MKSHFKTALLLCVLSGVVGLPSICDAAPGKGAPCARQVLRRLSKLRFPPGTHYKGPLRLAGGNEIYVDMLQGDPKKPAVIFVNGLIYNTDRWGKMIDQMKSDGDTLIRYDFYGQARSLQREVRQGELGLSGEGLQPSDFAAEIDQLADAAGLDRFNLVGLSYGAMPAAQYAEEHPGRLDRLLFMAPLVVSTERYKPKGQMMNNYLAYTRFWMGKSAANAQRDMLFRNYVRGLDIKPEPGVTKAQEDEMLFQRIRAALDFDLRDHSFPGVPEVHMMLADQEEPHIFKDQLQAWKNIASASKGSLALIKGAAHAVPDTAPVSGAYWLRRLLSGQAGKDKVTGTFQIEPPTKKRGPKTVQRDEAASPDK